VEEMHRHRKPVGERAVDPPAGRTLAGTQLREATAAQVAGAAGQGVRFADHSCSKPGRIDAATELDNGPRELVAEGDRRPVRELVLDDVQIGPADPSVPDGDLHPAGHCLGFRPFL
jgi:hypothetical protein